MMRRIVGALPLVVAGILLSGCARFEFDTDHDNSVAYFEPLPHFFVSTTDKCVTTASVIILPGESKRVRLKSGFGSSDQSFTLTNGVITAVGQKTDTKIPEMVTSIAGLSTALAAPAGAGCSPSAMLYPIRADGSVGAPVPFPVNGN